MREYNSREYILNIDEIHSKFGMNGDIEHWYLNDSNELVVVVDPKSDIKSELTTKCLQEDIESGSSFTVSIGDTDYHIEVEDE